MDFSYLIKKGESNILIDILIDISLQKGDISSNMMPPHLNEAFNDPERTVSEIITAVAPHLGKKFHDLQTIGRILSNMSHIGKMGGDISKVSDMSHMGKMGADVSKVGKLGGEMSDNTVNAETPGSTSAGTFINETAHPRVNLIDAIKSSKELVQDNNREENRRADTTTKMKKNKKKNVVSGDLKKAFSLMNLEHFALATAIGALRGKRNNSIVCLRDGLYGNEVLNDITMVLHMLQQKKVEKYSTIEKMMKQMTNLQQELQVGRI